MKILATSHINEPEARALIVRIGRLLYERGHVVASDGNLSIRLDEKRILATPAGAAKGRLNESDLAITDLQGNTLNGIKASSELKMHLLVYAEREDVKAVCHAHPAHGTAFAVANLSIDEPVLSEVILTLGCVPLTAYGTPSTTELTDALKPFVRHHNALLLANHGAVTYGDDLWQAFDRMETLDHTARISILARTLGGAVNLPPDAIEKLISVREKAGYLGEHGRCQACGYLGDTSASCTIDNPVYPEAANAKNHNVNTSGMNGSDRISLTREELIQLLSQAADLSK